MKPTLEETTRTKIIRATLELMGQERGVEISNRAILKEAGLANMSAISYHFGSKEKLIKQALQFYYDEMHELLCSHRTPDKTGSEALLDLANDVRAFISQKPGLEKAMLSRMITAKEPDPDFQQAALRNFNVLKEIIRLATHIEDDGEATNRAIIFMSGIVYPFLLDQYGENTGEFDSASKESGGSYIKSLVECVMRSGTH